MTQDDGVARAANERIDRLEKEVSRLGSKVVELEHKLAVFSNPRNIAAAVQDQASRRPQRTR
jgi:hypothetical protein